MSGNRTSLFPGLLDRQEETDAELRAREQAEDLSEEVEEAGDRYESLQEQNNEGAVEYPEGEKEVATITRHGEVQDLEEPPDELLEEEGRPLPLDPGAYTISELEAKLEEEDLDGGELVAIRAVEEEGQARKGALEAIDTALSEVEG